MRRALLPCLSPVWYAGEIRQIYKRKVVMLVSVCVTCTQKKEKSAMMLESIRSLHQRGQ
jgi:hypothetical protein